MKYFAVILLLLKINVLFSQDIETVHYVNQTSFSTLLGIGTYTSLYHNGYETSVKNSEISFCLENLNGLQYKQHQLGVSIGIDKWQEALLFPLSVAYKFDFNGKGFKPFLSAAAGYSFGSKDRTLYDDLESGSFNFKFNAGTEFVLTRTLALQAGLSYKLQNMRSSYTRIINTYGDLKSIEYRVQYHFFGIFIGVKFR